jgi:peptidylprolyl isomerase
MFKFSSSSSSALPNSSSLLARSLLTKQQSPALRRSFHASAANMVVKAHFDVSWTGPEYQTDASGKVTSKDDSAKREYSYRPFNG